MRTIAIQRDARFSPNSVEKDYAILAAAAQLLGGEIIAESSLKPDYLAKADVILNMGRLPHTLQLLEEYATGKCIVNSASGVRNCQRSQITRLMRNAGIPIPPEEGSNGYWLKRGDEAAQAQNDIQYCAGKAELEQAKVAFTVAA